MTKLLNAAVCALLCACGGATDPTADETSALGGGHDATLSQQQSMALADSLFDFDPTLDTTQTAAANAQAIATHAMTQVGCATATVSGSTATVTAAAPGCTTLNGVTFSGTVSAAVSKSGTTLTVALTFTNVVLGSSTVTGTMTLVTSDGTTFQVTYALTRNGKSVSGSLTAVGATGQITTSGTVVNGSTSATFTSVVWKKGDCYPSSGTVAVTQGKVTTTYTFSASTPSTGTVSTGRGRTAQLPAYGSCPAGAADAGP